MIFTKEIHYAVNAIDFISGKNQTTEVIAESIGAPISFLQRILMKLRRAGIISMHKGPGGGYYITEEQYRSSKVVDVLNALGHNIVEVPDSLRASDRITNALYDAMNVTLEEFLA